MAADPSDVEPHCRQRTSDVVVDFAGDGCPFLLNRCLQVFRQFGQAALGSFQLGGGLLPRPVCLMHLQGTRDDVRQALEVVFEEVVSDSQSNRIDGCSLADRARKQDKGWMLRLLRYI